MTASHTTYRPPWALTCWVDDHAVYAELPTTSGGSYVMSFPITDGGFEKALNLLRKRHRAAKPKGGYYKMPEPKLTKPSKSTTSFTDDQRAFARRLLKARGVI